jgi:hypothetical protein
MSASRKKTMKKIGFAMLGVLLAVLAACDHSGDKNAIGNKTAQLKLTLDYGVGYAIPGVVVAAINEFLSLFNAKSISASHGTSLDTKVIYEKCTGVPPSCDKP